MRARFIEVAQRLLDENLRIVVLLALLMTPLYARPSPSPAPRRSFFYGASMLLAALRVFRQPGP